MSMTRRDFEQLADILSRHCEALQNTDNHNVDKFGVMNVQTNGGNFSKLMHEIRQLCKEHNPRFDVAKFDHAVYGGKQ